MGNFRSFDNTLSARVMALQEEVLPAKEANQLSEFKVYQRQRNKKGTTSVSISPFFKGDGSYEDFTYVYFVGAFSDRHRITEGAGSSIIAERFGFGIEIELKITEVKTSLKGGFGAIGAAVDMGLASAEYSYHIFALPQGDFHTLLPPIGVFDSGSIERFRLLVEKLKVLYQSSIGTIDLVAIEILLADAIEEKGTEYASSYYFAARRIIESKSLKEAITQARQEPNSYNEDVIQYVYTRAEISSIEEKPTARSISFAQKLINE
jgi:hypothetical protein